MQDSTDSNPDSINPVRINVAGLSDIGKVRTENEDYFLSYSHPDWPLAYLIVADGMGGYTGGALASKLAAQATEAQLKAIASSVFTQPTANQPPASANDQSHLLYQALEQSIQYANSVVLEQKQTDPRLARMGTTIVAAVVWQDQLITANVGDSRAYLWQHNQLTLLSKDHSLVQELIDNGALTAEQAKQHQNRHQLTRALGVGEQIEVEINQRRLEDDCLLLLCTDGLSEYQSAQDISNELTTRKPLLEHGYHLIEAANQAGGKDNITVALAEFSLYSSSR